MAANKLLKDGFIFPEGPRWRDDKLWFSDQHAHKVYTVDLEGRTVVIAEPDDLPSGLGFLPDGSLIMAAMRSRRLLRSDGAGGLTLHADLGAMGAGWINDMVVDAAGRAYVGFMYGRLYESTREFGSIVLVETDGSYRVVADDVAGPNGTVITPDGRTLILAETAAQRLSAFDIQAGGSLANHRVFAKLEVGTPDGICLDAEGAVWVASPRSGEFVRFRDGGEIADRIMVEDGIAIACMLGGPGRRTLFMLVTRETGESFTLLRESTDFSADATISLSRGRIETVEVEVPGAGWP